MATTFYLPASASSTPISPTPDAAWEDVSIVQRALTRVTTIGDAMATVSFTDSDDTSKDVLFRQFISQELKAGQTITGSQAWKIQVRCKEGASTSNMVLAMGIRVIASDGTTVRKTVLAVARDTGGGSEFDATQLENMGHYNGNTASTNYTTQAGDRLVFEIGAGGDPAAGSNHNCDLRFGDSAASDLPQDSTTLTDLRPWVQLTDTLVFVYSAAVTGSIGPATAAVSATFEETAGEYTAAAAGTVGAATSFVSATFTKPTYTATVAGTIGAATLAAVVHTAQMTVGATVAPAAATVSAAFTQPISTASIAGSSGPATAAVTATFSKPTYTAAIAATAGPATAAVTAAFPNPTLVAFGSSAISGAKGTASSYSFNMTVSGHSRLLLVAVAVTSSTETTVASVTFNSVGLTLVGRTVSGIYAVEMWKLVAPDLGTHSIAIALSGAPDYDSQAAAANFVGVNQTSPLEGVESNGSETGAISYTITSTTANAWSVEAVSIPNAAAAPTASQISRAENQSWSFLYIATKLQAVAGDSTLTWDSSGSDPWSSVAGFIKPKVSQVSTIAVSGAASAATASVSATFEGPVAETYTASVAAVAGPAVASASAQFAKPTYATTIAAVASAATASVDAEHTVPTYTVSVTASAAAATASALVTHAKPIYTAAISAVAGVATSEASAAFTVPTYTAAISAVAGAAVASATVDVTNLEYEATIAATAGAATASVSTVFAKPTYTTTIAATAGGATLAAGIFIMTLPQYKAFAKTIQGQNFVYLLPFANLQATTDPGATNDASENYSPGSPWINKIGERSFICIRSTIDAAVWQQTSGDPP